MKPSLILANLVGMMLFVQVILGGSYTVLRFPPVIYHLVWGTLTFAVLIVATVYAVREYGSKSTLFRVGIASIADYVVQVVLGVFRSCPWARRYRRSASYERVPAGRYRDIPDQLRRQRGQSFYDPPGGITGTPIEKSSSYF